MATPNAQDITGTLPGLYQALTLLQAQQAQQQQELAQRTQQTAQAAQQAQGAYQGALQAPPPELNPFAQLIPQVFGSVASVLAQDQGFAQRGREKVERSKAELAKGRAENLQALHDAFVQKAKEAEEAGDLEATTKNRQQAELAAKRLEVAEKEADRQNRLEVARIGAKSREDVAAQRAEGLTAGDQDELDAAVESVVSGQSELTHYPIRMRGAIVRQIRDTGQKIMPTKVRTSVNELAAAEGVMDEISSLSTKVNTGSGRGGYAAGAKAAVKGLLQDPEVIAFNAARRGFLATISRASGERGVLTDADVGRAKQLLPVITDSKQVARRKIQLLRDFLASKKSAAVRAYTTPGAGMGQSVKRETPQVSDPLGIR